MCLCRPECPPKELLSLLALVFRVGFEALQLHAPLAADEEPGNLRVAETQGFHKQQLCADQQWRSEVEGCFGSGTKLFTRFDHGSTEQWSKKFYLDGLSGGVRRDLRFLHFFYHYLCLVLHVEMDMLPEDGAQEHLAA